MKNEFLIRPDEHELVGKWLDLGSHLLRDDVCARIEWLVNEHLVLLGEHAPSRLYRDPTDGRLWEWTTLAPFMKTGSPTTLMAIKPDAAREKYNVKL